MAHQICSKPLQERPIKEASGQGPATAEPVEYADLRSRLLAELSSGEYDCVICYSTVTTRQATWSCSQCYSVLHLPCVRKWAESSVKKAEEYNAMQEDPEIRNRRGTWRCPGCQYAREDVPKVYWCWCGRTQDPPGGRGANPHGCGQRCRCGRCAHGCADACHPGPCPPCAVTVSQQCFCGAKTIPMRCSQTTAKEARLSALHHRGTSCGDACGKKLDCGVHSCREACHPGECQPCSVQIEARCYCGKHTKTMRCGDGTPKDSFDDSDSSPFQGRFACEDRCERRFDCGVHSCSQPCHARDDDRPTCPSSPQLVKTCPCGVQTVTSRTSCQDPIPTCGNICGKMSNCGHPCPSMCHLGPCPLAKCRCRRHAAAVRPSRAARATSVNRKSLKDARRCFVPLFANPCATAASINARGSAARSTSKPRANPRNGRHWPRCKRWIPPGSINVAFLAPSRSAADNTIAH